MREHVARRIVRYIGSQYSKAKFWRRLDPKRARRHDRRGTRAEIYLLPLAMRLHRRAACQQMRHEFWGDPGEAVPQ